MTEKIGYYNNLTKSKIFLFICLSLISGIFFGSYFSISIWILFLEVGFFISLVFLLSSNKKARIILLLAIFILLGFIRIESGKLSKNKIFEIENLNNQEVLISGEILQAPEMKNGKQKLMLENIQDIKNSNDINGKMIVYAERYPEYNFKDKIKFESKIKIPEDFDGFEYRNYLFAKGIYYIVYYPEIEVIDRNDTGINFQILQFRTYANKLIKKIFSEPQAGIVSAMTLGVKSGISSETLESFNKTGTRHIIAISGLHMMIVSVVFMHLLLAIGLKRNHAFYFAILGIVFFVALVGFPPSAVRAAVMGGLVLFAVKAGRLNSAGNAVIFAGVLMLLHNPNLLRYDTGFQLSFTAVLGIIYIFPRLDLYFKKYSDRLKIKTMFLVTISAQIATLPIIINSFGNFSLLSVFANILILPLVPIVMLGGLLLIIIGFANLSVAQILSWPIHLILFYQVEIIKIFASFDLGYLSFKSVSVWFVIIYYGVLVIGLNLKRIKKYTCNLELKV
ncbi:ComEC/Rec2 family competence protein [Candidatus Parcubacteria bacterium]|nr:ComEC/Rec2 family competence protein [Candidatus Parcubacteria bacterium]